MPLKVLFGNPEKTSPQVRKPSWPSVAKCILGTYSCSSSGRVEPIYLLDKCEQCGSSLDLLQISPDAQMLSYLAPSKDKDVLNVWVQPAEGPNEEARMVTSDELRGIRQVDRLG